MATPNKADQDLKAYGRLLVNQINQLIGTINKYQFQRDSFKGAQNEMKMKNAYTKMADKADDLRKIIEQSY